MDSHASSSFFASSRMAWGSAGFLIILTRGSIENWATAPAEPGVPAEAGIKKAWRAVKVKEIIAVLKRILLMF